MSNTSEQRRALRESYRQRPVTGGVFQIVNTKTGKRLILAERDLAGSKNRFSFSVATGSCINFKLAADWDQYGASVFSFEILEELEKKPEQSDREFNEELQILRQVWVEKYDASELY